jgi:translocator protein
MMGGMTVTSRRSTVPDVVRCAAVAVLAVLQVVVAALGSGGQAPVANELATPLLAAGWAFSIWGVIYLGFLAYALYQALPSQRGREVHRRTGWWLAASAALNPLWIVAFGARWIPVAQVLIVALLVALAVVFGRLSREPAADLTERVAFRGPIALYTGWVSVATVLGTAATGVWVGLPGGTTPLAAVAAVVVLLAVTGIVGWVVLSGTAVVPYAAAVVWALLGIALNDPPTAVVGTAAVAIVVVVATTARRISTAGYPNRAAWG